MPLAKDARPLRISERSNGLQFSRSFYFSDTKSSSTAYAILERRGYSTPASIAKTNPRLAAIRCGEQTSKTQKRTVSSLVPPYSPLLKPRTNSRRNSRRLSSSSASIRSVASSTYSRRRKRKTPEKLNTLPREILDEIASHLQQQDLHSLALTCRATVDSALWNLYESPTFASTYRFAQFVHIITHRPAFARRVKCLDLSSLAKLPPKEQIAGWREWKHRNNPIYSLRREPTPHPEVKASKKTKRLQKPKQEVEKKSSHPLPSQYLEKYATTRDIPTGALLHILSACPNIEILNLSRVPLAQDYFILSDSQFTTTAFTKQLFVSDVEKVFTWKDNDTREIKIQTDVVDAITRLKHLRELYLVGSTWVNRWIAKRFAKECTKLKLIDLTSAGMVKRSIWAVRDTPSKVAQIIAKEGIAKD